MVIKVNCKNAGERLRHSLINKPIISRVVLEILFQVAAVLFFIMLQMICFWSDTSLTPHSSEAYYFRVKDEKQAARESIKRIVAEEHTCWVIQKDPYLNNVYDIIYISADCLENLFRINSNSTQLSEFALTNNAVLAQQIEALYAVTIVEQNKICLGSNMINRYGFLVTDQKEYAGDVVLIVDGFDAGQVARIVEIISEELKEKKVQFDCRKSESYSIWKYLKAGNIISDTKLLALLLFVMKEFLVFSHKKKRIRDTQLSMFLNGLSYYERIIVLLKENTNQTMPLIFIPLFLTISKNVFISKTGRLCFQMLLLDLIVFIFQCLCLGTRKEMTNSIMEL